MELTWLGLRHDELSARQMHDLLQLRHDIFVIEQDCPDYRDIDGLDATGDTRHVIGLSGDDLIACARILAPDPDADPRARIGRVVVAPAGRGSGVGHELMRQSVAVCDRVWPGVDILLSAQAHLEGYYARYGFEPTGHSYVEDDIPHIDMVRSTPA